VDQFFPDYSTAERAAMVNGILSSHPTRFDQIYATVIFSEEYLLRVARLKNAEEALFNAAARLKWAPRETTTGNPGSSTFTDLNNENSSTLSTMGQAAMRYKLGRLFKVPTDTLSFAYYHSALRGAMIAIRGTATDGRAGWIAELYDSPGMSAMTLDNYIRYAFITAAQRQPTDGDSSLVGTAELPTLKKLCTDLNYVNISSVGVRQNIARLIFDYVSRLPETYAYNR
ncbi:MAG: hypothetical protein OEW08_07745, partial [Gammaproteobacteria bacterium]|nr:hypothetical protein [Gammaproteobacteria bacterium]